MRYSDVETKEVVDTVIKYCDDNGVDGGIIAGYGGIVFNLMGYFAAQGLQSTIDNNEETPLDDVINHLGGRVEVLQLFEFIANVGYEIIGNLSND